MSKKPLDLVDVDKVVNTTREMVRIPSQYIEDELAQHAETAEYLANEMERIGLDVDVKEEAEGYPVVSGITPGGEEGPVIGVIGHYSTVAIGEEDKWTRDPLGAEMEGNRIYGRGSCDQKGGIAAVLHAAECLMKSDLPRKGRLRLLMVPGEGCTRMALEPVKEKWPEVLKCDAYLDSDGGPGAITLVYGGWIWLELLVRGRGGHAGSLTTGEDELLINPVERLLDVLNDVRDPEWMEYEKHPLFNREHGRRTDKPIVDITVLRAGSKVNIVPTQASALVDIRLLPSQLIEPVLEELDALLDELRDKDDTLDVSYRILNTSKNPREVSPDDPMIQAIKEVYCAEGLEEPELTGSIGGGRGTLSVFGPVMSFGAGGGRNAHAPDEYTTVEALERGARMHARIYGKLLT